MGCESVVWLKGSLLERERESVGSEVRPGSEDALEQVGAARRRSRRWSAEVKKGCGPLEAGVGVGGCLMDDRWGPVKGRGRWLGRCSPGSDTVKVAAARRRGGNHRAFEFAQDRHGGAKRTGGCAVGAGACLLRYRLGRFDELTVP